MTKSATGSLVWLALLTAPLHFMAPLGAAPVETSQAFFEKAVRPTLGEYCLKCHSAEKHKGDLDLERFTQITEVKRQPKVWQAVIEQLNQGEMPPKEKPQPGADQREQLVDWANAVLDEVALARAGDPGPVVLRRLSNAEYTYTIRDLTGVESLNPAREFPVDGAAGEGFMNVGNSLVMSPALLTKYLDAGKDIASHAVLLPDGLRFSPGTSRRDWTDEIVAEIRALYGKYTEKGGGTAVNLQGIKFDTKDGGVIPLEKYFQALLEERESGQAADASRLGLSAKYLATLRGALNGQESSLLLDLLRARWRTAKPGDAAELATIVFAWQRPLWKFNSVGHIGKVGGPKAWLEPFSPLKTEQETRLKLPATATGQVTLYLVAGDAGDGAEHDFAVWKEPRLVAPGRAPLPLRDLRANVRQLTATREKLVAAAANALQAAAEVLASEKQPDLAEAARKHQVDPEVLGAWLSYLGIATDGSVKIDSYFTNTMQKSSGYDFINGWGSPDTPLLVANSSDQHVRIPGNMKPHSVAVHPSPKLQAVVGWRSPITGAVRVSAVIQHAHPECGNGVTWAVELRRGSTRQRLAAGVAQGAKEVKPAPIENLPVRAGDFISVLIGPRDGNHACDLTAVDLVLATAGENPREWNLAKDVSPDVLASNPHADSQGNAAVWHFYTEPDGSAADVRPSIPADSLLARWQQAPEAEKRTVAGQIQTLLTGAPPASGDSPDGRLYQQLTSLGGPLVSCARLASAEAGATVGAAGAWGLDPGQFGVRSDGSKGDPGSLYVRAPAVLEIQLPADLAAGADFVATAMLDPELGQEGSVQLLVQTNKPASASGLRTAGISQTEKAGPWHIDNRQIETDAPLLVRAGSAAQKRIENHLQEFRDLFPAALCYTKIVPVDEVITLTLFHREDQPLERLMLNDEEKAKLDRLWSELRFVSRDALTRVDVFEQLWQYATQDADPKVFEPLREPIRQRAAAFREWQTNSQPSHLQSVLTTAAAAYRRPLTDAEQQGLRDLYQSLRAEELGHEDAIRLTLARVFVAPAFLYHTEKPGPGDQPAPVSDWELASRLSYFLWSSLPDRELWDAAASGTLHEPAVLAGQARRMLRDPKMRRMATEFGCAWLHIYAFDELGEKSERHFPTFTELRTPLYEESILFFTDLFRNDRSVLEIVDGDYTYLNEALAKHYGIPGVAGAEWRRVEGVKQYARGGILGLGSTLAKQSGASRTSPILRGNWVSEVLLGEKLPRPPKDVPRLPEDEAAETLTVRQLTEQHSTDPRCAGCHRRIDSFGFALEKFDAIGRRRERDLGNRPIEVSAKTLEGAEFSDIDGLRRYILVNRHDAFLKQFCRKLLGYSLGRGVQLSDGPLLAEMRVRLKTTGYHVSSAVESIVLSRQFRQIRGRETVADD